MQVRGLFLGLLLTAAAVAPVGADELRMAVAIPAQPLKAALQELARQANLQLVYETDLAAGLQSSETKGELSVRDALERLLQGTGLRYQFLDERTVAISQAPKTSSTSYEVTRIRLAQAGASRSDTKNSDRAEKRHEAIDEGIETVVVTARRRQEAAQAVPVSVTALTEAALERKNFMQPEDLSSSVAGLISMPQATFPGGNTAFIRGIGATETLLTIDPPVAQYRDSVYIGHTSTLGNVDMTTLEQIEVLRGPQGTLFGRNTTGGAINFVTRAPRAEFGVTQRLRYGSFNELMSATTIDTGKLANSGIAGVLTYQHRQRDGYIDDPTARDARDPGSYANDSVLAKLHGEWGRFNVNYTYDYTWTPPFAKRRFRIRFAGRDCSHTSGLCLRRVVAGPDGISWSAPDHFSGLKKSRAIDRLSQPRSYP